MDEMIAIVQSSNSTCEITEEKHDVAKVAMELCPVCHLFLPWPRHVTLIQAHNAVCDLSTDAEDNGPNDNDSVDYRCISPPDIPFPKSVKIQLLTKSHPENKVTSHRMRNVRKFPLTLCISFDIEHEESYWTPCNPHPPTVSLKQRDSCFKDWDTVTYGAIAITLENHCEVSSLVMLDKFTTGCSQCIRHCNLLIEWNEIILVVHWIIRTPCCELFRASTNLTVLDFCYELIELVKHWRCEVRGPHVVSFAFVTIRLPKNHISCNHIRTECDWQVGIVRNRRAEDDIIRFHICFNLQIERLCPCKFYLWPSPQHWHILQSSLFFKHYKVGTRVNFSVKDNRTSLMFLFIKS